MSASVIVKPEVMRQFHQLAEETHRPEVDIINEALAGYLAADRHYVEELKRRIAASDRAEFASEKEVEAFFREHGE